MAAERIGSSLAKPNQKTADWAAPGAPKTTQWHGESLESQGEASLTSVKGALVFCLKSGRVTASVYADEGDAEGIQP